jgi:hypothetical protein
MPSADENMRLLWLILSQKLVDGQITGIDWNIVASGLNLEKSTAANLRWSRLKKDFLDNGLPPMTGDNEAKPAKKARTPRAKNPKEKVAKDEKPKKVTKKRKLEIEEEATTTGDGGAEDVKSDEELSEVDPTRLEGVELEEA